MIEVLFTSDRWLSKIRYLDLSPFLSFNQNYDLKLFQCHWQLTVRIPQKIRIESNIFLIDCKASVCIELVCTGEN